VIVHVLLRGGMDGLTLCVPWGAPELYAARPTLAVPPPGQPNGALDLDGFFGLAPAAAPLLVPWNAGHLAIVHACGSTDPTRSHFDGLARMELGIPGQPLTAIQSGWLARHLASVPPLAQGALRSLAVHFLMPRTLLGADQALPIPDLAAFGFPGDPATSAGRRLVLTDMYASQPKPLGPAAEASLAAIDLLGQIDFAGYLPANGAAYGSTQFARELKQVAALLSADVGVEAVFLEMDGWDTHAAQGPLAGRLADLLADLTQGLAAFDQDLHGRVDFVVVVMSEFGRRVAENASAGTDHGHGNCMLVMGDAVAGGQVLTQWPGLAPQNLDHGDLAVTIDYRDVLAEILEKRAGNTALGTVFPNHVPSFPGVIV
jgi:uncharacterized protein (DUF1501 family)